MTGQLLKIWPVQFSMRQILYHGIGWAELDETRHKRTLKCIIMLCYFSELKLRSQIFY